MPRQFHPRNVSKRFGLILIGLMIVLIIVVPTMAEGSRISVAGSDQNVKTLASARDDSSNAPLKASTRSDDIYLTLLVGQELQLNGWTESGSGPTPGVPLSFERSVDNIDWCPIYSAVSDANGYIYLRGYTETCPGVVSYWTSYNGMGGSNRAIVTWTQTNPSSTCVPIPKCVQKKYSITCIENYDHICDKDGKNCNIPGSIYECNNFANALNGAGLRSTFYSTEGSVVPENFATNPSSDVINLTRSSFHYHSGHGTDAGHLGLWTYLNLKGYDPADPLNNANKVGSSDVQGKWGGNLKWVMLDSCNLLKDTSWHSSLTTAHGILGFSSDSEVKTGFPQRFMDYAKTKDWTIADAYKQATIDEFHNPKTVGTIITKTSDQYNQDQFPGLGTMAPDGDPGSDHFFIKHWDCREGVEW